MNKNILSTALVVLLCAICTFGSSDFNDVHYSALTAVEFKSLGEYDQSFGAVQIWGKVKDKILSAWNNLVESAKNTNNNIKEWLRQVQAKGKNVIAETKEKIKEMEAKLREQMRAISEKAKEVGVDVKECLKENEDEIKQALVATVAKLSQCVVSKVSEAEEITEGIRKIIESAADIGEIIRNRLDECRSSGSSVSVPKCLSGVAGQIMKEATKVSKEVVQSSIRMKDIFQKISTALPACAAENAADISVAFAKLAITMGTCVKDKMDQAGQVETKLIYLLN